MPSEPLTARLKHPASTKRWAMMFSITALAAGLSGCSDADVASRNISKAADQFEISRRVVFYNDITGEFLLTIEGLCSLGNYDKSRELTVTCKTGPATYKKHFLGLSDNVTFFAEQTEASKASTYHYRVIFKPSVIIPDVEFKG
ncbi:beta-sandwich lipoprotein [Xanthobacter versatilis]|uniref:beta-sandwich lipoprotein n=1 Tax=Xanthobacter autotrophicus (strain ATCC BAA-1158 / Py2) TaxID=78245 RepID=UPI00372B391A